MFYPRDMETRIEDRSEVEKIQPILDRIIAQIAAKQKDLQNTQQQAADISAQAEAARRAGDYRAAFKHEQNAIAVQKVAAGIKAEINKLDAEHERLLYRARSGSSIERR